MTNEHARSGGNETVDSPSGASSAETHDELVTVVITTYNRPSYLVEAVKSVQRQTYEPIEVVVVDDHSDTPASTVLDTQLDGGHDIECVRHTENSGANAARNTGIRNASGTFVAFLDDDDRWEPTKIETQVAAFRDHEVGVTYTGAKTVSGDETSVYIPPGHGDNLTKRLLCQNVIGTLSAVMVRTEVARETPLDEQFPSWADLEWYVRLSLQTEFHRVPRPLVVYEFDSHNRLSDDLEKKRVAYERFLDEFDDLAARYGELFRRKMHAWAAYRLGSTALSSGNYDVARPLFLRAFRTYPLERRFLIYALASLGGRYTHEAARGIKRAAAPVFNIL